MPSSQSTYNTYHFLTNQGMRPEGRGRGLLLNLGLTEGVWRGWEAQGSWELGLSPGVTGGGWILL